MNLHGLVRGAITAINPDTLCTWQQSTGSTTGSDGTRMPTYNVVQNVPVQVQGLTNQDLQHIQYLNIQSETRKVYLFGQIEGVERPNLKGGDLLTFPQTIGGTPQVWLVVQPQENWPDELQSGWSSAIVCLQTDVVVN